MATIPITTSGPKSTSLRQCIYIYGYRHHVSSKGALTFLDACIHKLSNPCGLDYDSERGPVFVSWALMSGWLMLKLSVILFQKQCSRLEV